MAPTPLHPNECSLSSLMFKSPLKVPHKSPSKVPLEVPLKVPLEVPVEADLHLGSSWTL